MTSLTKAVATWVGARSDDDALVVTMRDSEPTDDPSVVHIVLSARGASEGAPRPEVKLMRLGEGTSMVCTGDEDQYEGFNSAAAQV